MNQFTVYDVPDEGKKCLGRDVWTFVYFEREGLVLERYAHEERDSLRQKFRPRRLYDRLTFRNRSEIENVPEDKAPLPDWVKERAKELFCASVKVRKWEEARR